MANTEFLLHQAQTQFNSGQLEQAYDSCVSILQQQPTHAEAHYILGHIYCQMQHLEKGVELLITATQLDTDNIHYLNYLVINLMLVNRLSEARGYVEQMIAIDSDNAFYWDTIGLLYRKLDDHSKAVKYFSKAIKLAPKEVEYLYHLATSQRFMGEFKQAELNYEKILSMKPDHYHTHFSLSELNNITKQNNHINRLEQLLNNSSNDSIKELYLSYALYKEYDTLGDFTKAFEILKKGNAQRSKELQYQPLDDEKIFDCIISEFSNSTLDNENGFKTKQPIFVLGMPRSGTTLVDRIITSHSEVISAGELQSFGVLLKQASKTTTDRVLDEATIRAGKAVDFSQLGQAYIESTRPVTEKTPYFVDKMPINYYYIGFILRALPNAKIVCLDRNPMDTCIGNFRQLFAVNLPYYQYSYDLVDTGKYYIQFKKLMEFWMKQYPNRLLSVKYEELVQNPEAEVRRILSYCELEWQPQCLEFHKNKAAVATASSVQVRQPINTKFIGRWKKYQQQVTELTELFDSEGIEYQ